MLALNDKVVSVEQLTVTLPRGADRRFAVEDVSLDIGRGEILCVVGESGSGKSVLSSAIMGALPRGLTRTRGRVLFDGQDLTQASEAELRAIRGNTIAMVFQDPIASLNPALTAGAQIEEVFQIHTALPPEERRDRVIALLAAMHLPDPERIAASYPHQLSGGQCQRVIIAMALALKPTLLIADEPTTALDVTTQAQILKLFLELRNVHEHGVMFVTHDFGVVREVADRVAVMEKGRLVEIGSADAVLGDPQHAYTKSLLAAVPSLVPKAAARPAEAAACALKVEGVATHYGATKVLKDVDLKIDRSTTLAIVGESGSGKSTLARTVIRLIEPTEGRVLVDDLDFAQLPRRELSRRRRLIQMIFQNPFSALNPRRTVGDVLTRAGMLGGLSRADARARALELLRLVRLGPEAMERRPEAFSGGQRQRISIARALAMSPQIVIADESVSALDVSVQRQVLDLMRDLQRDRGMTMMFITHDLRVAAQIADVIAVMRRGEIVEFGPAAEILQHPRHAYTQELVQAAPGRDWTFDRYAEPAIAVQET